MIQYFLHSVKILLVAVAIGALGSHFLLAPLSQPAKILAISILLLSTLIELIRFQAKKKSPET